MRRISLLVVAFFLQTQVHAFTFPFFKKTDADPSTQTPVTSNQLDRLNKTIEMIQCYYIHSVDEKKLMDNAIAGMVTQLDPHSAYLTKEDLKELDTTISGEFVGIGVELTTDRGLLKVISPLEDSPAAKAGLKPGDLIVKVNNKLIQDMAIKDAINQIKGKPNTPVTLTVLRKDEQKPLVLKIIREVVRVQAVKSKMLSNGYGYIRIAFFQGPVTDQVRAALKKLKTEANGHLKGLVLDLRNDPGGLLDVSTDVLDMFLDKKSTARYQNLAVYTKGRIPNSDVSYTVHDNDMIPHTPMIVLINNGSASASEIVAGALQDYKRAIIMGTRSFGKGSVQTVFPISDDSALKLTTALYYTPAGREIQAHGIEPDIIVPELTVNEKQHSGLLDFGEANFDHHIENHAGAATKNTSTPAPQTTQQTLLKLAKEDYQLYEALMMLKGMHAMR